MQDERFQSVAGLNRLVDQLQDDSFCVGPGRADAKVVYQLYKARREVGDAIRQRTTVAQAAFVAASLFALYALSLAKRAVSAGRSHNTQFELLGHADGAAAPHCRPDLVGRAVWVAAIDAVAGCCGGCRSVVRPVCHSGLCDGSVAARIVADERRADTVLRVLCGASWRDWPAGLGRPITSTDGRSRSDEELVYQYTYIHTLRVCSYTLRISSASCGVSGGW